jgi:O-antigen ligase
MGDGTFRRLWKGYAETAILIVLLVVSWLGFGDYMMGLFCVVFLISLFLRVNRQLLISDKLLLLLVALFTLNNIVSSLLSIDPLKSALLSLVWVIVFFLISYVRFTLGEASNRFFRIIGPTAAGVTLIIVLYLISVFVITYFREGLVFTQYHFRFLGKAQTADTLVMVAGIGYGWLRGKEKPKYRWLGFVYLLLGALGVFLTRDRGGVMAYFAVTILLLATDYKRLLVFFALVASVIGLSFRVEALQDIRYLFDYLTTRQGFEGLKVGSTLDTFKAAWLMIQDHWLLGVGTNNFSTYSTKYNLGNWYAYAHNIALQFWAENGLFGMLLGLSIIGLMIYRWAKSLRSSNNRSVVYGFGIGFIGLLIGQMTNTTIWLVSIAVTFWLIAGVINAVYFEVKNTHVT